MFIWRNQTNERLSNIFQWILYFSGKNGNSMQSGRGFPWQGLGLLIGWSVIAHMGQGEYQHDVLHLFPSKYTYQTEIPCFSMLTTAMFLGKWLADAYCTSHPNRLWYLPLGLCNSFGSLIGRFLWQYSWPQGKPARLRGGGGSVWVHLMCVSCRCNVCLHTPHQPLLP